jgi:hypothetical protein
MKGKLIPSIAGLTLALGLSVANAGQAPGVQDVADDATNVRPAPAAQSSAGMEAFSEVLGSAHYVPMSDRELSRVNGKQLLPLPPVELPEVPPGVELPPPPEIPEAPPGVELPELPSLP